MLNKNNKLYDNSIYTAEKDVWKAYGFCITLRVLIGICAILGLLGNKALLTLSLIITYTFLGMIQKKGQTNWKSYWKPVLNYSAIAILNSYHLYKGGTSGNMIAAFSGMLIINDAVAGLESRLLVNKLS